MQSPLIVLKGMNKEEKTKVLEEIVNDIKPLIKEMYKETSKITLLESEVDEYETMTFTLCGGLNGSGEWYNSPLLSNPPESGQNPPRRTDPTARSG